MKKCIRSGAAVLAILCFCSFISFKVEKESPFIGWNLYMPQPPTTRTTYRVGWGFSPWLTYKSDEARPALNLRSGSWLALAAAIALMGVYAKLSPAKDLATDQSSA
jgi:hypothetical protein